MREIKDSLIRALFKKPEKALQLYSDISGKAYDKDTNIEMKTFDELLLSKLRNDIAFVIEGKLIVIMEHQSTLNRNMPLRLLKYVLVFYEVFFGLASSLYKGVRIKLPKPEFYVLYNGKNSYPAIGEMRLSESFWDLAEGEEPALELIANMININYDDQSKLLNKNKDLMEYSIFVEKVSKRQANGQSLQKAVRETIKECLAKGILKETLKEYGDEVINMISWVYDEELAIKYAKEEAREEGLEEGRVEGRVEGMIQLYFTKLKYNAKQIAKEMNLAEDEVNVTLRRLGLV